MARIGTIKAKITSMKLVPVNVTMSSFYHLTDGLEYQTIWGEFIPTQQASPLLPQLVDSCEVFELFMLCSNRRSHDIHFKAH